MRLNKEERARLKQSRRTYRLGPLRVEAGVDLYEDHGPCWRLMIGDFEVRYWLGTWGTK